VIVRISIIVSDATGGCPQCRLLRLALILLLLGPGICLRCCDEILMVLIDHAGRCHSPTGLPAAGPSVAGGGREVEHTHVEVASPPL
jgi:hypothetical protein